MIVYRLSCGSEFGILFLKKIMLAFSKAFRSTGAFKEKEEIERLRGCLQH